MGSTKWSLAKGLNVPQNGKAVLTFDIRDDEGKKTLQIHIDLSEEDVISFEQAFRFARGFFKGKYRDYISGELKK